MVFPSDCKLARGKNSDFHTLSNLPSEIHEIVDEYCGVNEDGDMSDTAFLCNDSRRQLRGSKRKSENPLRDVPKSGSSRVSYHSSE